MKRSSVLLAATIGFGLLYLGAGAALGTPPGVDEDGRTVAAWFAAHGSNVRWWLWLLTLAGPVFAVASFWGPVLTSSTLAMLAPMRSPLR